MACRLTKEQIIGVAELLGAELRDKYDNPEAPVFNIKDFILEIYNVIEDKEKALVYAEAIPSIIEKAKGNVKVRKYFRDNDLNAELEDLLIDFEDIDFVKKYLKKGKPKRSKESIQNEIERYEDNKENIPLLNPEKIPEEELSPAQESARVRYPLSLTSQFALIVNPKNTTEEERNIQDREKAFMYRVIKDLIFLARKTDDENPQVIYQDTEIKLGLQNIDVIDPKLLTKEDAVRFSAIRNSKAIIAFVTDSEGNILYFNNEGSLTTKDSGKPVYQFLRYVVKKDGGLVFQNSEGQYSTLADAESIAKSELEKADIDITDKILKNKIQEVKIRQEAEMNQLYKITNFFKENPESKALLPITGGSYGASDRRFIPLSETDIRKEDVANANVLEFGDKKGFVEFVIESERPSVTVEDTVLLQRGDMDKALATKIADVLTTKAKLNGKELFIEERIIYYNLFLSNAIDKNRIEVISETVDGEELLIVKLDGEELSQEELYSKKGKDKIVKHLLNAVQKKDEKGNITAVYPANINYNAEKYKSTFTDYQIEGDTITEISDVSYFDYLVPYIKIEYSKDSSAYFVGVNSYLSFSIPEELAPLGEPSKKLKSKKKTPKEKKKKTASWKSKNPNAGEISMTTSFSSYQKTHENNAEDSDMTMVLQIKGVSPNNLINHVKDVVEDFAGFEINLTKSAEPSERLIKNIVKALNAGEVETLNLVGSNRFELSKKKVNQSAIDDYIFELLKGVIESPDLQQPLTSVILTGQTGIEEAFVKAASELEIPVKINALKEYNYVVPSRTAKNGYRYVKGKKNFAKRFGIKVESKTRSKTSTKTRKEKTKAKKTSDRKQNEEFFSSFSAMDIINSAEKRKFLDRSKAVSSFLDRVFTTKADRKKAQDWWDKTFGNYLSLERVTEVVNSDAFATFIGSGVILYEGDGGTSVDLYHEAYHGFTQLFLTKDEKIKLYKQVAALPKWANKTWETDYDMYRAMDEDMAEDFRSYMKFKKKFPGFLGKVFSRIANFLRKLFSKVTRKDLTRPRDIPAVKEIYDKLYKADKDPSILQSLKPSTKNIIFGKMDRSKDTIGLTKSNREASPEFTIEESRSAVEMMDVRLAAIIQAHNTGDQKISPEALLTNPYNLEMLYKELKEVIKKESDLIEKDYKEIALKNVNAEVPDPEDIIKEQKLSQRNAILTKIRENFGDIGLSLSGKQKSGALAYHLEKSRYKVLQESYEEDESDDPTNIVESRIFKESGGNLVSSKKVASQTVMTLLSTVFEVEKVVDGKPVYKKNSFGDYILQPADITWNRLAKILSGSFDYKEMYTRLLDQADNYPEIFQILQMLPDISKPVSKAMSQYKLESAFWQDLKKPRIGYIQLKIEKETDQNKSKFTSSLTATDYNVYRVLNDWMSSITTSSKKTNPYLTEDDPEKRNAINTAKIIKDFSVNGKLNRNKAVQFLAALGIELDTSSHTIKELVNSTDINFAREYKVDAMFDIVKRVDALSNSDNTNIQAAVENFKSNPVNYLRNGLPVELRKKGDKLDVSSSLRRLALVQIMYSDSYSNFSVTNPEGSRVWEHFLDSTITRIVTSINKAENWQQLTQDGADPNNNFQHMRWLAEANNTFTPFSQLLRSIFYLDRNNPKKYGQKRPNANLLLQNVSGTQLVTKDSVGNAVGSLTASTDATSKFLQEMNTMLLNGVEEFMRHASKNTAMGITTTTPIETYDGKKKKKLYVDIEAFRPTSTGFGESKALKIIKGYLAAEANRIHRFLSNETEYSKYNSYTKEVRRKDGKITKAGAAFTIFDDMLTEETQKDLYKAIQDSVDSETDFEMFKFLSENSELNLKVEEDLKEYFDLTTKDNLARLKENTYIDQSLYDAVDNGFMSRSQVLETITKGYTYNQFIHKFETIILAYGDAVQYNHEKEEFHKRNAGLAAGGRSFRADLRAQAFINANMKDTYSKYQGYSRRAYDGTMHTAIMKEDTIRSKYYDEYYKKLEDAIYNRLKDRKKAKELATKTMEEYKKMAVGDGQGYISLDSYKMFKLLEDNWSNDQDRIYKKIVAGETISFEDVVEYFPPYKVQYFGNIKAKGLPVNSFHKFSLMPLIPGFTMEDTALAKLHDKMMDQQLDYVLFESGSKINQIGNGDAVIDADGNFNDKVEFTKNIIFAEYLKNQTEVNSKFKQKSIFSTQMRKLILEGLYEKGVIATTEEDKITEPLVKKYIKDISEYTEVVKLRLLNEIGFREIKGGYEPINSESTEKLVNIVRERLTVEDIVGDDLIELVDVNEKGEILYDISLHPEAEKIEKLIISLVNKRVIKQKVKGEPLVQVASSMLAGGFTTPLNKLKKATDAQIKKYAGSNFLPNYQVKADGTTAAAKVMIALQGDYENLLNLAYDENSTIRVLDEEGNTLMKESLERLNEKIKDDAWLDANDEANRKAITLVGARIPVQGLNSMEFFEVYHFLPPEAGNIIVPPAEIVAKSGADFDIDKLTMFMTNIDSDGKLAQRYSENLEEFIAEVEELMNLNEDVDFLFDMQQAGLENEIIDDMRKILALPQNFVSLISPNGTYILKEIADDLAQYVMDYNPLQNKMTKENMTVPKDGKSKRVISPTRIIESLYNIYKHESNVVGKKTLGLGAIENTFHTLINSLEIPGGASMPTIYYHTNSKGVEQERESALFLKHNKTIDVNGEEAISIASRYDANNEYKIADVISQMMNGWVDVEKDAWIFFIQGNYEVAPVLLYLIKAGVPAKDAIYFVSQPLVREYVKEQRLIKSTYADMLGKKQESLGLARYAAASEVIGKFIDKNLRKSSNFDRYTLGMQMGLGYLKDNLRDNTDEFTQEEMYDLIKDTKEDPSEASSELSKAMFMHYLIIEQQIAGLTKLKMNTNPDTSTKSNVYAIEETLSNLEELESESKINKNILDALKNDSVISSFFNGPLILALSKELFKLRFHPEITNFLIRKKSELFELAKDTFGEGKKEEMIKAFRNDIVSYIFQNTVRKYKLGDSYKSYTLNETVPIKYSDQLKKTGAFAVKTESGEVVMYVDKKAINKDYKERLWAKDTDSENSYTNRGLYPVDYGVFLKDSKEGRAEYLRFVIERELLRSIYSFEEVLERPSVKKDLSLNEIKDLSKEKKARYVYEKFISERALENIFNPYQLFQNKQSAFAIRFNNLVKSNPNLKDEYEVLNWLSLESNSKNTVFNLMFNDKDLTKTSSNLYRKNLKDLADPTVIKSKDPLVNLEISELFQMLPLIGFMQSGLNNTKYNILKVADLSVFNEIMNTETNDFIKTLEANPEKIMNDFFSKFESENNRFNQTKGSFKDYLTNIKFSITEEGFQRNGVNTTLRDNIFEYNDATWKRSRYDEVTNDNPDIGFVYSIPLSGLSKDSTKIFSGQAALNYIDPAMNISLPTDILKVGDNMEGLSQEKYNNIKGLWERRIEEIKSRLDQGLKVAFSTQGYGDPALMPKELFVYLSRRLFEEFGYRNPGSVQFEELKEVMQSVEEITDEEIEVQFDIEEDPFKC